MKKIIPAISIILLLLLSACSNSAPETENSNPSASSTLVADLVNQNLTASAPVAPQPSPEAASVQLTTDYTDAVSIEMQLLLGSIKLEGTELAITKEQANVLLPLWTNLKNLNQSMMPAQGGMVQGQPNTTPQVQTVNTEAQTQLDEIAKQIQATMTPEQIKTIATMQLTQESSKATMQELGIPMNNPQPGNGGAQLPPGDTPQGTPPTGADQMAPPPDGMQRGMGFIPQELLDELIQLLQQK